MSSEPPVSSWNEQIQKTTESVANLIRWIAELILRRNWFMLLVLLGVALAFVINILKNSLSTVLPGPWLWLPVALPFAAALIVAVVTMPREQKQATVEVERQAIKGLRPFGFDDAEIYLRLQRRQSLADCLEVLSDTSFRFGILMGESGCGKTSFLQAGVWPRLTQPEGRLRAVYVRFSDQDPLLTIRRAVAVDLKLPEEGLTTQTPTESDTNQGFIALLHQAVEAAGKPVVLLLDQFEQFFVHYRQPSERQPFVEALATWYRHPHPPAVKVLVSIRSDMLYFLDDLHKAMAYALGPQEVIHLKKFTPAEATNILAVIAETEHLRFDRQFVTEVVEQELASRGQGEISPVDLQILAWMIERQSEEGLRAFNREAFQRFGGVEGLLNRFLEEALAARMTTPQRQAAVKVLLAMTDMERQARAGVLSTADLTAKLEGNLTAEAVEEAVGWLARGDVRLITPGEREAAQGYELAHERLIPALMRLAGKELSEVDQANQLLDRRVNEWLGNQRSRRYLLNWGELRSVQRQRPYLVWGAKRRQKERLLAQSQRWVYGGRAVVLVLLVVAGGLSSWLLWTPQGQIQQVRWQLESPWYHPLNKVSDQSVVPAALAFAKDGNSNKAWKLYKSYIDAPQGQADYLGQYGELVVKFNPSSPDQGELDKARQFADAISDPFFKADALSQIAAAAVTLEDQATAKTLLQQAFQSADALSDPYSKADALGQIAAAAVTLADQAAAKTLLQETRQSADAISDPSDKADALSQIAEAAVTLADQEMAKTLLQQARQSAEEANASDILQEISELYANQGLWKQALTALNNCIGSERNQALTTILTRWAEKDAPTLIDGAVVLKVTPTGNPKAYTFEVDIQSPGDSCEKYTDWWEVIGVPDQKLIHRQVLSPKDQAKSPFTSSSSPVKIQPEDEVIVRAHLHDEPADLHNGYEAQQAWRGSVAKGFKLIRTSSSFAERLADEDPQPPACED